MTGGDVASEISTRVVSVFFLYFEHAFGRARMEEAFRDVGGEPTLPYVLDPENFVSLDYCTRVARVLTERAGDPQFLRKAGLWQFTNPRMFGFPFYVMRSLGSPSLYYRLAVKTAPHYNRVCDMTIEELTDRKLLLRYRSLRDEGTRLMCEGRLGQLGAVPTLWGLPPAEARELECQMLGAPACRYEFQWQPRARALPRVLPGALMGAAVGAACHGAFGAVSGSVIGALAGLALTYRAAARITERQVLDGAAGTAQAMAELRRRFDEVQRLHAETEASHSSLREEMRRRETAEAALIEAQKLEAVGRLSGGVAHDFNNILTVILGSTAYAKTCLDDPRELETSLDAIEGAARRASDLTKRLLAFARRQVVAPRVVSIDEQLRQLERMVRSLVGEAVTVTYRLGAETARVLIDPTQLEQVLMNLAVNARDAMPRGGTLRFESAVVELRADDPALAPGLAPGSYVRLEASDTGHGMDEATLRRAFEPFFTTKEPGRGTGLGLATCHGIVVQAGGAIAARSVPGVGTTLTLHLPRVAAAPQEDAPARPAARGGGETVLVVEDDAEVRAVVVRTLVDAGYDVLQAANGAQAIEVAGAAARRIHLLVTDVVMDGGDGRMLAERLRSGLGALPVLFVSGYPYEVLSRHGVLEEGLALLSKPFSAEDLLDKVRGVLDGA